MATNNEDNTQNQEQHTDSNAAADKEAVSFDEMTVLSREGVNEGMGQADRVAGGQAQADDTGNDAC